MSIFSKPRLVLVSLLFFLLSINIFFAVSLVIKARGQDRHAKVSQHQPPAETTALKTKLQARRDNELVAMLEDCREKIPPDKIPCYQKRLEGILKTRGTEQALKSVEQLAKQDPDVLRESHPYTHHLGRISFSHYKDAAVAFSHCGDMFASGCYHGVLEGYLSSLRAIAPKDIVTLCNKSIDTHRSRSQKFQCLHGLGHGLTMYFRYDILKTLPFCDTLPTDWERQSCYGGVFMENIVAYQNALHGHQTGHKGHHTGHKSFLDPKDPLHPCNVVEKRYQRACYWMQASVILTFNGFNLAEAFRECDKAPARFIPTCYESMGREISGFTLSDSGKSIGLCKMGSSKYVHHCFVGAVKDFINTRVDPERGLAFCRGLDLEYKKDCYAAVGWMLVSLYPDLGRREDVCTRAEKKYTAVCKASAYSS